MSGEYLTMLWNVTKSRPIYLDRDNKMSFTAKGDMAIRVPFAPERISTLSYVDTANSVPVYPIPVEASIPAPVVQTFDSGAPEEYAAKLGWRYEDTIPDKFFISYLLHIRDGGLHKFNLITGGKPIKASFPFSALLGLEGRTAGSGADLISVTIDPANIIFEANMMVSNWGPLAAMFRGSLSHAGINHDWNAGPGVYTRYRIIPAHDTTNPLSQPILALEAAVLEHGYAWAGLPTPIKTALAKSSSSAIRLWETEVTWYKPIPALHLHTKPGVNYCNPAVSPISDFITRWSMGYIDNQGRKGGVATTKEEWTSYLAQPDPTYPPFLNPIMMVVATANNPISVEVTAERGNETTTPREYCHPHLVTPYCKRVIKEWEIFVPLQPVEHKVWTPKNPEVIWPLMPRERSMTKEEWRDSKFPHFLLPELVVPSINSTEWATKMAGIESQTMGHAAVPLLRSVLDQIQCGANSEVGPPGTSITKCKNFFTEPDDCMKMADALATQVKGGNLAGPMDPKEHPLTKINAFMAIPKPLGHRRQVGNLSSPAGNAFNDGIPASVLRTWPVTQTTAKQFSIKITRAGWRAVMSKCDMVNAYKLIKVCLEQRRLQGFMFCGKLFLDLCLIFGDKAACMWYDRFHFCILSYFVLPKTTIPGTAVGETVDDITAVAPDKAESALAKFVNIYRQELASLNIEAAASDPECTKAFDGSRKGEILGVIFNTKDMSWNMGLRKTKKLADRLWSMSSSKAAISLHEAEVLVGEVEHFTQLATPITLLVSNLREFLKNILSSHTTSKCQDRDTTWLPITEELKDDCRTMAVIVKDTMEHPLPILLETFKDLLAIPVYTDASGCLNSNPSLGILIERHNRTQPLVASLRFPYKFLHAFDKHGHAIYCKSTLLESLGYLATLLLCPHRFQGLSVSFMIDSLSAVSALKKGFSPSDELTTTIVKASRVVAASLNCDISSEWIPRRSNRQSTIADDLTHNLTASLNKDELDSYLAMCAVSFPLPILQWMDNPVEDHTLGRKCWIWMDNYYPNLIL